MAALIKNPTAAVTFQKDLPAFDGDERDEEKAQVMIDALQASRRQTTLGAGPWLVIYLNFLGLYSAYKEEEVTPPAAVPRLNDEFGWDFPEASYVANSVRNLEPA